MPDLTVERSAAARWVESNSGHTLTDDEARCIDVLCPAVQRPYNLQLIDGGWQAEMPHRPADDDWAHDAPFVRAVEWLGNGLMVRVQDCLGTYDGDELTRLVLAAHRCAVRVEIRSCLYLVTDLDGDPDNETGEYPTGPAACLEILLTVRQRTGTGWERHPTIEQAMEAFHA